MYTYVLVLLQWPCFHPLSGGFTFYVKGGHRTFQNAHCWQVQGTFSSPELKCDFWLPPVGLKYLIMEQHWKLHAQLWNCVVIPVVNQEQTTRLLLHMLFMWQSWIEITPLTCFDHITVFEVQYCWTSVKGGAHLHVCLCTYQNLVPLLSTCSVWALPLIDICQCCLNAVMESKYITE